MENLSPGLVMLLEVRAALENGYSVRTGVLQFLKHEPSEFSDLVSSWLFKIDQGQDTSTLLTGLSPCRRAMLMLFEKGLRGLPILIHLQDLEEEFVRSCEAELDEQIQKLPVKLLIPVLLLMFPAYLLLLLGPILMGILTQLSL